MGSCARAREGAGQERAPVASCSSSRLREREDEVDPRVRDGGAGPHPAGRLEPAVGGCRRCPALGKPRARRCRGATAIEHLVDDVAEAVTRRRLVAVGFQFLMLFYKYEIVTAW